MLTVWGYRHTLLQIIVHQCIDHGRSLLSTLLPVEACTDSKPENQGLLPANLKANSSTSFLHGFHQVTGYLIWYFKSK